ncbi:MAG: T9SS type A sorting domain-containing protein, partial [Bacteroidales bacterium]|nr:T9SS type A sorting domain-containing protein [Bacteroidales bacterium]
DTKHYTENLYFGKTYYWRVKVINSVDTSDWSTVWTFNTRDYVSLNTPSDGALNQSVSGINLDWYSHTGVDFYNLQIDKTNQFNSIDFQEISKAYINSSSTNSDTYQNTGILDANTIYFWRVRVINTVDTSQWNTRWFSTGSSPLNLPEIPVLISPSDNSTNQSTSLTFDWQDANYATSYELEYSENNQFTSSTTETTSISEFSVSDLTHETVYYWRVRASDGLNFSEWSEIWSFNTNYPTPTLISPANNSTNINYEQITFEWSGDISGFWLQISEDPTFTTFDEINTSVMSETIYDFTPSTTYFWRVRYDAYMVWSDVWSFTTSELILSSPTLISPANNSTNLDSTSLTFEWNSVTNATEYVIEIAEDSEFSSIFYTNTTSYFSEVVADFSCGTTYYWHVKASDGTIESNWSYTWVFSISVCTTIENLNETGFNIYPNPVKNDAIVNYNQNLSGLDIQIIDIQGKTVLFEKLNTKYLDLSGFESGVYIAIIKKENKVIGRTIFIKE